MEKVILSIDTTGDYMISEIEERGLKYIAMAYIVNSKPMYEVYNSSEEFYEFFNKIDNGMTPTTTQLNLYELKEYFNKLLSEANGDIVHFTLSSGLSGTYQCAFDAADEINKELAEKAGTAKPRKIHVVDTKGATQTICHIVENAVKLRNEGKSAEEIAKASEEYRDHQQIFILVNDLSYLKRGGRISGVSAAIGTLLSVKPIIILNDEGKLIIHAKALGFKKAASFLVNSIKEFGQEITKQTVIVAHTGPRMLEYSRELAQKFESDFKCKTEVKHIGTVIGTHLGPDAIAVIFSGKKRLHK